MSLAQIVVLDADDVVFAEIAAGLHLDQFERNLARIFHAMRGADGNIDRLVLVHDFLRLIHRDERRTAHFHAVVVLLRHAEDPQPLVAEGSWHGRILRAPRGEGGFGYDPVFLDPEHGRTAAELEPALKNRASHRGRALAELARRLPGDP